MPEYVELRIDTIAELGIGASEAFAKALTHAVRDCIDRPADERARKIVMQVDVTPVKEVHDNVISCEGARAVFKVRARVPDYETDVCDFGVKRDGRLFFNPLSPRNHRQNTLDFMESE